jgi:uracil-DNA glycosylase family protein
VAEHLPLEEPYYRSAEPLVPQSPDIREVANAAKSCQACHLWRYGNQTVFGEGSSRPAIMLVGEQPGDKEDLEGHPFVGPAGKVLDEALEEAGIDPAVVYKTNAVKHFKWEPSGNRRLHKKPNRAEMGACRPWLEAEIRLLQPQILVCLGATAAQSLLGPDFKLTHHRGEFLTSSLAPFVLATIHPSAILRMPDMERRHEEKRLFIEDLRNVAARVA